MSKNNAYYLFQNENNYYLYDVNGEEIIQIKEKLYNIIKKYRDSVERNKEEQNVIDMLLKNGFLSTFKQEICYENAEDKIAYLSFAPTYKCNFRCKYCFGQYGDSYKGDKKEFTPDILVKTLDYFFNVAFKNSTQYRIDFVSGGEPLLGFEIVKKTIEYVENYVAKKGKRVSIWLCTNGSLLTTQIAKYLSDHNVSIGISIDGRKEYNDVTRPDVYGNGTYEQICKGIKIARQEKNNNLWGLCTATNDNCNFVDILQHMKTLGFSNVQIRLVRSNQKYNTDEIKKQYTILKNEILKMYLKEDISLIRLILNDNDQFGKVFKRVILNSIGNHRCHAGVNKITICPDGSIYPCDSFVGISEFMLGNINSSWNRKIFSHATVNHIDKCNYCDIKYLCTGDCYYNSFVKNNDAFCPDEEFCVIQRHILELAIVLRYEMQINNNKLFEKIFKEIKLKDDYSELYG